jgi:HAMP domain-containing protein
MIKPLQTIRQSLAIQLTLWVAGFVLVITGIVIVLLGLYSQEVIKDEALDTARQTLETTALRVDNKLRLADMAARLEHKGNDEVDKLSIEQIIREGDYIRPMNAILPNAKVRVVSGFTSIDGDYRVEHFNDKDYYFFYHSVSNGFYTLILSFPEDDISNRYTHIRRELAIWSIIGIVMLILILYWCIARYLKPLDTLADTAHHIAQGHSDETIPASKQSDEIGQLQNSLAKMQTALTIHMKEMKQNQSMLNRQIVALETAYSDAQAYDNLKTKLLRDLTDRMGNSVETICRNADIICNEAQTMPMSQLMKLRTETVEATDNVTKLLEQLLKDTTNPPSKSTAS